MERRLATILMVFWAHVSVLTVVHIFLYRPTIEAVITTLFVVIVQVCLRFGTKRSGGKR